MNIFHKGRYEPVPANFRVLGISALRDLSKFQEEFEIYDTDTTINSIRDSIIANYLGYNLLNMEKHGFDAKNAKTGQFLEIKQCSISSTRWGGTWNDTNEEKAKAFSDERLFTAVAIWKGASDLQFMVYGQHEGLGRYILDRVTGRKNGSRSTQSLAIEKLIKDFRFDIICPPDKNINYVYELLVNYNRSIIRYVKKESIKQLSDI